MLDGSTVERPLSSPVPTSRLTPCACPEFAQLALLVAMDLSEWVRWRRDSGSASGLLLGHGPARPRGPSSETVRLIAPLASSRNSGRSTMIGAERSNSITTPAARAWSTSTSAKRTSARRRRSGQAACSVRPPLRVAGRSSCPAAGPRWCAGEAGRGARRTPCCRSRAAPRPAPSPARAPAARPPTGCRRPDTRSEHRAAAARPVPIARSCSTELSAISPAPTICCAASGSSSSRIRAVTRALGHPSACAAPSSVRPLASIAATASAS